MTFKHKKRIPPVIWAVVADRSRGRVFSAPWPEGNGWEQVTELSFPEGALAPHEARSDGPGTFAEIAGGHHGGQEQVDYRHQTAEQFAGEIVQTLENGRTENRFGKLALVAPPLFLGVLRKKLPTPLAGMVAFELDKDYTNEKRADVAGHLQAALANHTE